MEKLLKLQSYYIWLNYIGKRIIKLYLLNMISHAFRDRFTKYILQTMIVSPSFPQRSRHRDTNVHKAFQGGVIFDLLAAPTGCGWLAPYLLIDRMSTKILKPSREQHTYKIKGRKTKDMFWRKSPAIYFVREMNFSIPKLPGITGIHDNLI